MTYRALSRYRSELMGCAMLWVMLFHAFDLNFRLAPLNFIRAAGFGGVDIFIVLSAMGLVMSFEKRAPDYGSYLVRRLTRILPAYFAVMLPYTLYFILTQGVPWSSLFWNSSLLYYWVHCPGAFNWYVGAIVLFYLFAPPCWRFLRRQRHRAAVTAAGVMLGLLLCQLLLQDGYWQYIDFFYRVPLFFLGLLMGLYAAEDKPIARGGALFWTLAAVVGAAYLALWSWRNAHEDFPVIIQLCHLFLFTTVPMCLTACVCFERLPLGVLRRGLRYIGEHSLEIYLLNVSVFFELEPMWQVLGVGPRKLYFLALFALNILCAAILHKAVNLIIAKYREICHHKGEKHEVRF